MPLPVGAKLGPYEIGVPIGAGGMGEVYRARDTRLDRTVAIKVLGPALALSGDASTLEHEARAVAALNHPHICAIHDVGREAGAPYLVMEHLQGETLAARLGKGPLPLRDVLRYGIQIAEALDHAHRHGIVHRDLKPANIMLTPSGVKVLDFGLATLRGEDAAPAPPDKTPAPRGQAPSDRALLGTVYYVAPERLEGRRADARSDLFSFGGVLYEMATGAKPFEGESTTSVIAGILRDEPAPPSTVQPGLPPALDWVVLKALTKDPEARWQSAGDLVEILQWLERAPGPAAAAALPPPRRRWLAPVAVVLGLAVAGLSTLIVARYRTPPPDAPSFTFPILPPAGGGFTPTPSSVRSPQFALSPDGRRLVFVASTGRDAPQLWIRAMDSLTPEPVPDTQDAEYPFWAPDSGSLGFFAHGSLKRVDLAGGPARTLAPAAHGRGGAWSRSGIILFAPNTEGGLFRVPEGGGDVVPVTRPDTASLQASHRWPQFLPDDRQFVYFVQGTAPEGHGVYMDDLERPAPRKVVSSSLSAAFAAPGHLLFVANDTLMAAAFDPKTAQLTGEPFPLVPSVAGSSNFFGAFSAAGEGVLVYATSAASSELVWIDRAGKRIGPVAPPADYVDFRLSPDDTQLAVAEVDPQSHRPDIRVLDLARGAKTRLTSDAATDASPVWSADGRQIVFRSNRSGLNDLYTKAANGSGPDTLLLQSPSAKYPTDSRPGGRGLVFHTYERETGSDIWLSAADGSQPAPIVKTGFHEMQGQVSSDGAWLAYASLESGQAQVYVRSLADEARRWQVSAGGGTDPRWRGDGRELYYISADSWMTTVSFTAGAPAAPQRMFQVTAPPPRDPYLSSYDVSGDGSRFLMKVAVQDVTSAPLHVLANWLTARRAR